MIRGTENIDRPIARPNFAARLLQRKSWLLIGGFLLLTLFWAGTSFSRWLSTDRSAARAELRFATVVRGDLERDLQVEGQVVAARNPTVFSPTRGIAELLVEAGETVAAGQVIASIASPELSTALGRERNSFESALAEVEARRVGHRQAELEQILDIDRLVVRREAAVRGMARAQKIYDEGLVNVIEYERAQDELKLAGQELEHVRRRADLQKESRALDLKNAELALNRQRAVVADLERQVEELQVRAPLAGQVGSLAIQNRDAVNLGQPIATVVDLSLLQVEIDLPESLADEATVGQNAALRFEGRDYAGKVVRIAPAVAGGLVRGQVAFAEEAPAGIKQNQRVSCRLLLDSRSDVIKVDRGPWLELGGGKKVWVVEGQVARPRAITIGVTSVREVEVVTGLQIGEEIIISDTSRFGEATSVLIR